ncbi:hypothetical protein RUM44_007105 [Polyplax serrata]|uniref:Uncharacterized protein n=1 Tax=Polyplax serrata TaxID=468196 RepID=A0ABR1AZR9_POLSC
MGMCLELELKLKPFLEPNPSQSKPLQSQIKKGMMQDLCTGISLYKHRNRSFPNDTTFLQGSQTLRLNADLPLAELEGGVKERYEQEEEIVKEKQQGWEKVLEQPKRQKRRRNSDYSGENVLHGSCQSRERRKPRESPELLQSGEFPRVPARENNYWDPS